MKFKDLELKQLKIENNIKSLDKAMLEVSFSNNFAIQALKQKREEERYELGIVKEQIKRWS